jgi:hypothetical protein
VTEQIVVREPTPEFPEGRRVLVGGHSLRNKLVAAEEDAAAGYAALRDAEREAIDRAKEALAAVPPEKRPV